MRQHQDLRFCLPGSLHCAPSCRDSVTTFRGLGHFPDTVFGGDTGLSNTSIRFSSQLHLWMGWCLQKTARGTSIYSSGWTLLCTESVLCYPAALMCSRDYPSDQLLRYARPHAGKGGIPQRIGNPELSWSQVPWAQTSHVINEEADAQRDDYHSDSNRQICNQCLRVIISWMVPFISIKFSFWAQPGREWLHMW